MLQSDLDSLEKKLDTIAHKINHGPIISQQLKEDMAKALGELDGLIKQFQDIPDLTDPDFDIDDLTTSTVDDLKRFRTLMYRAQTLKDAVSLL